MKDTQSRKWQITLNFKTQKQIDHAAIKKQLSEIKPIQYYCMADEIGLKEKNPHTHIFIACSSPVRFSTIKRHFHEAHIEQARGSCEENKSYVEKSGKWENDPKGDTSIKGTFVTWGEMFVERTRYVMEREGYAAVYRVTEYEHPFDGYAGQETLVLDEYRSQLKISELLNLLDGYPLELRCRYSNKTACFTTIYIISNLALSAQYPVIHYEQPETWQALLRRIHHIVEYKPKEEVFEQIVFDDGKEVFDE